MRRRTRSLDGAGWWIRAHPGTEAALAAAGRARPGPSDGPPGAPAIHAVHDPDPGEGWIPARVPGSVLDDLLRAGQVPDVYHERNSLLVEWVPERAWTYRTMFELEPSETGRRTWLRFHGIDHAGHVFVDGLHLGSHAGMFVPFEVELPPTVVGGVHELAVVVEPAPENEPQVGRTSRVGIHKARLTYGWDFCPRLVHQGLWQSVELVTAGPVRIRDVWARPILADDAASATVGVRVELDVAADAADAAESCTIEARVAGAAGRVTLAPGERVADLSIAVAAPELWWPNGAGEPTLHELEVRASADGRLIDERRCRIGFRRIEMATGPEGDGRSWDVRVNGRPIEILGWNWTPSDALYGVPRPERVEHLLGLVVASGANLVRVWGGGLIESDAFYDACDRLGVLVWQEFSQSSSGIDDEPSADPAFVALMRREAEAIVPLRRNHPSLAIWCGGNELQSATGPLEDAGSPVLAAVHEVVARLDPDRIWLPTSPSGRRFGNRLADIETDPDGLGDVHGPWEHQGLRDHNVLWDAGTSRLNGEFGVEGMTNRRAHEALIGPEHRWPADRTNPVYRHLGDWWINAPLVRAAFGGRIADVETLRRASQHLQADGLRYAVEANRRRWPRNRGSVPWQLNESFPNAWCTAVVDHGGDPKPAFHAVARAYAHWVVCARFPAWALDGAAAIRLEPFAWGPPDAAGPATITCRAREARGAILDEGVVRLRLDGRTPQSGGGVELGLAHPAGGLLVLDLELRAEDRLLATNRYLVATGADFGPIRDLPPATLDVAVDRDDDRWCLRLGHRDGPAALGVRITDARPAGAPGWAEPADDGFHLLPGESRAVAIRWSGVAPRDRAVRLDGWNLAETVIR